MPQIAKINPNISKIPPAIYDEVPRHLIPEMITLSLAGNNIDLELLEQDGARESDVILTANFQKKYPNLSSRTYYITLSYYFKLKNFLQITHIDGIVMNYHTDVPKRRVTDAKGSDRGQRTKLTKADLQLSGVRRIRDNLCRRL